MQLICVGMNHNTAPVSVRERLARHDTDAGATGGAPSQDLAAVVSGLAGVEESVVLATCNRLEVYVVACSYHQTVEDLLDEFSVRVELDTEALLAHLYIHHHYGAARHLFRVVCGLDSMVLGETEILGQVRNAYRQACRRGSVKKVLHGLFQRALHLGKRARTETAISRNVTSLSGMAVEFARKHFGGLSDRGVLLVGAGTTAERAAEALRRQGASPLWFSNRTKARAAMLAERFGGRVAALEEIPGILRQVDVVIVSTSSSQILLTADMLAENFRMRSDRPILLIDLSVPRNVDPAAAQMEGISLVDVDALASVVQEHLRQRREEVPSVEALIRSEVASFAEHLKEAEVAPLIRSLRQKAEQVRREEVEKLWSLLPDLDGDTRKAIETATTVIVKRILNEPTVRLRRSASEDRSTLYARALRELFDLSLDERLSVDGPAVTSETTEIEDVDAAARAESSWVKR